MKLDLACGLTPPSGFVGVDRVIPAGAENMAEGWVQADLFAPSWPFRSSSIEAARCSHFVEHVPNLVGFMDELWRILEPDAPVEIAHPYQFSVRAWQDPTHVRALNEVSWFYYSAAWRSANDLGHYPMRADFRVESIELVGSGRFAHMTQRELAAAAVHQVNVVDDLRVTLVANKPERTQP